MHLQTSGLSVLIRGHKGLEMGEAAAYDSSWLQFSQGLVLYGTIVSID